MSASLNYPDPRFAAVIYCFLSTCLGLEIRRSDVLEAFTPSAYRALRNQNAPNTRGGRVRGEYEMDNMGMYDRVGEGKMGSEEVEMMRRGGPGRFY